MAGSESFDDVIGRLRDGDDRAAVEIFQRFASRLMRLARSRMDTRIRGKVDPEDVLQSALRSFFVRQAHGQFELDDWDSLWSLLVRITLRKCGRRIAAFRADCRDVRREVSPTMSAEQSSCRWEGLAREPTPAEAASLADTVELLMRGLEPVQQQVVMLRLQGYTVQEISQEIHRTERTIHRVLAHVRQGLKRLESRESG